MSKNIGMPFHGSAFTSVTNVATDRAEVSDSGLFKWSPCPLCNGQNGKHKYPIDKLYATELSGIDITNIDVGVYACARCGHQFIQPIPTSKFLRAYYGSYMIQAKENFYRDGLQRDIPERFRRTYVKRLQVIKQLLGGTGTLLDIGCGLGMFLRLAKAHGFIASGVEANNEAATRLRSDHGLSVENCLFESFSTNKKFDVVTMWDLLEHLADPVSAIRKAYSLLNPGGILVLETPARDSVAHWVAKLLYRASFKTIKSPLHMTYGMHHLQYFSRRDLSSVISKVGFDVVRMLSGSTDLESLGAGERCSFTRQLKGMCFRVVFAIGRMLDRSNKVIVFAVRKSLPVE